MNNYAFIDGQNLYQWLEWSVNYKKFRVYLNDKYHVKKAFYFLWFWDQESELYENLQEAGFILVFNLKWENLKSNKKWNVDTCLVFNIMEKIMEEDFDKVVLVSWDGDYKVMVDYLVERNRFEKVIAPNLKFASSLYKYKKNLEVKYFTNLNSKDIRKKIEHNQKSKKKNVDEVPVKKDSIIKKIYSKIKTFNNKIIKKRNNKKDLNENKSNNKSNKEIINKNRVLKTKQQNNNKNQNKSQTNKKNVKSSTLNKNYNKAVQNNTSSGVLKNTQKSNKNNAQKTTVNITKNSEKNNNKNKANKKDLKKNTRKNNKDQSAKNKTQNNNPNNTQNKTQKNKPNNNPNNTQNSAQSSDKNNITKKKPYKNYKFKNKIAKKKAP